MRYYLTLSIFMLSSMLLVDGQTYGQESRTWTNRKGTDKLVGTFVKYDSRTRMVSLDLANGESIDVPLNSLSKTDQRFVKRNRLEQQPGDQQKAAAPPAAMREKPTSGNALSVKAPKSKAKGNYKQRYGINWVGDLDIAKSEAVGKPTARDDRPIMWFRVLGDLDGYM